LLKQVSAGPKAKSLENGRLVSSLVCTWKLCYQIQW